MGRHYHQCLAGCGKHITWNFAICSNCEKIYGNRATKWPPWLRFLWNDEQRKRRRTVKIIKHEIQISELDSMISEARNGRK